MQKFSTPESPLAPNALASLTRYTPLFLWAAALWFTGTTVFHESFSNEIYVPIKYSVGPRAMEYLNAGLFACAIGGMCILLRCYANFSERLAWLRWGLLTLTAVGCCGLLMVTNIEIFHYFQYMLLVMLLRAGGITEGNAYCAALLGSLVDEGRQYLLHPRYTGYMDWNDLVINALGMGFGILIMRRALVYRAGANRVLRRIVVAGASLCAALAVGTWAAGRMILYYPLPKGMEPTAFPMVDGLRMLVLSLRAAPGPDTPFWSVGPLDRHFHAMTILEGCIASVLVSLGVWLLVRRPLPPKALTALLCVAALSMAPAAWAQTSATVLPVVYTSSPPTIDGIPSEKVWEKAVWTDAFMDMVDASAPWLRTEVALLWDQEHLYVAVRMEEPHLEARISEHDGPVYRDPDFELFIAAPHAYYELEINALGTQYDVFWIWRDSLSPDSSYSLSQWDESSRHTMLLSGIGQHRHPRGERVGFIDFDAPKLRHKVALQGSLNKADDRDHGWTLEIALPWQALPWSQQDRQSLQLPPKAGDMWPVNLSRFVSRDAQGIALPPLRPAAWTLTQHGEFDSHMPERFALMQFLPQELKP